LRLVIVQLSWADDMHDHARSIGDTMRYAGMGEYSSGLMLHIG
jgi:hypothetical protein